MFIVCLYMATLTEVFPCFFLSCKANTRVKPAKTGHGPHSSYFLCFSMYFFVLFYVFLCCSMYCLFCVVLCIVFVYMCTELLPPGGYPIAVKYNISYEGARGGAVGWGTALQVGRSRVLFPMVSLDFFIDIILPAALWPWGRLSL